MAARTENQGKHLEACEHPLPNSASLRLVLVDCGNANQRTALHISSAQVGAYCAQSVAPDQAVITAA